MLRLIRDWKGYRNGKVFDPPAGVAQILLRRKIAELVAEHVDEMPGDSKRQKAKPTKTDARCPTSKKPASG